MMHFLKKNYMPSSLVYKALGNTVIPRVKIIREESVKPLFRPVVKYLERHTLGILTWTNEIVADVHVHFRRGRITINKNGQATCM